MSRIFYPESFPDICSENEFCPHPAAVFVVPVKQELEEDPLAIDPLDLTNDKKLVLKPVVSLVKLEIKEESTNEESDKEVQCPNTCSSSADKEQQQQHEGDQSREVSKNGGEQQRDGDQSREVSESDDAVDDDTENDENTSENLLSNNVMAVICDKKLKLKPVIRLEKLEIKKKPTNEESNEVQCSNTCSLSADEEQQQRDGDQSREVSKNGEQQQQQQHEGDQSREVSESDDAVDDDTENDENTSENLLSNNVMAVVCDKKLKLKPVIRLEKLEITKKPTNEESNEEALHCTTLSAQKQQLHGGGKSNKVSEHDDTEDEYTEDDESVSETSSIMDAVSNNAKLQRRHQKKKPPSVHKCDVCEKTYSKPSLLRRHKASHFEGRFICKQCGRAFSVNYGLDEHIRAVHNKERNFACDQCDWSFFTPKALHRHKLRHTGEKAFSCKVCNKKFSRKDSFNLHRLIHTAEKQYTCAECGDSFRHKYTLTLHMRTHTNEKPYSCKYCNQKFAFNSGCRQHQLTHEKEKPYKCKVCDMPFSGHSNLLQHEKFHQKRFRCNECNKTCATKSLLTKHMRGHGYFPKPQRCRSKKDGKNTSLKLCEVCGIIPQNSLYKHMQIHLQEKPYDTSLNICEVCGIILKSNLSQHMRIHSQEKPYGCADCGKHFRIRSNLVLHTRIHTGELPFECQICGKHCRQTIDLKRHESAPHDIPCKLCTKFFIRKSEMISHMKMHHQ